MTTRQKLGAVGFALEEADAAWLAGIIDGEGHIRLDIPNGRRHRKYLRVVVVNTSLELLEAIVETVGAGKVYERRAPKGCQRQFCWQIGGRAAEHLLRQVLPRLIVKKHRAEACLEYYDSLTNFRIQGD